jgi:sigma-B regulation protein RsbU (phosphoserine phosphatase)
MTKTATISSVHIPETFTDVIYLTDRNDLPAEVKRLLRQMNLSFFLLPIEHLTLVRNRINMIGTIVVDVQELSALQQQQLARLIEWLENENVGVIILTDRVKSPVRSFSLAPSEGSFSLGGSVESVSIGDLWSRIGVNLAYRKPSSGITVKPAGHAHKNAKPCKNRLSEQLQATEALVDNLTEQLRMAGLVQRDFLPAQLPNCDVAQWTTLFLPVEWVSGDIYDVARIDEQHIGFYVADAVGHAMPAALLTIFVKQSLVMRETLQNNYRIFSPADVMKNLNVRMSGQKLSGYQFATCCYCLLNIKTLQLTFARAGHPYPVLIRSGQMPEQLEVRGSLLGVFENAEFVQRTVQLLPGDKLILYSDGVESFIGRFVDEAGFRFNDEFCDMKDLSIQDLTDELSGLVRNRWCEPSDIDDITVVGLEIL